MTDDFFQNALGISFDEFEAQASPNASSGYGSKAASVGYGSKAASSGEYSKAASVGYHSKAASSGYGSKAASSGDHSKAASVGDYSQAASSGENSGCAAIGCRAAVKASIGNLIMASEYKKNKLGVMVPLGGKASIVDGKKIKPDCWYIVENGEWVEVDFTDNIFTYVLYTKGRVKKVKDDNGKVMFIVTDGENSAHGKTIKEAREALIYKISSRDTTFCKDWKKTDIKPIADIIKAYRAITGACEAGARSFVESKGGAPKEMKISDVFEATKGAFGAEQFKKFFK